MEWLGVILLELNYVAFGVPAIKNYGAANAPGGLLWFEVTACGLCSKTHRLKVGDKECRLEWSFFSDLRWLRDLDFPLRTSEELRGSPVRSRDLEEDHVRALVRLPEGRAFADRKQTYASCSWQRSRALAVVLVSSSAWRTPLQMLAGFT